MIVPIQLIVFSIPSLIYIVVQRRRGKKWAETLSKIGWQMCPSRYFLWGLGITVFTGGLSWLAIQFISTDVLHDPAVNTSSYAGWTRGVSAFFLVWLREAIYVALGEEIFFRGLLGGWLTRRFDFAVGNAIQTAIFLLPHLLLLLVSLSLWPIVLVQLLAGWLLGWLRYHSDSILPGWLAHGLVNAIGALAVML